jgi:hypothetical protein
MPAVVGRQYAAPLAKSHPGRIRTMSAELSAYLISTAITPTKIIVAIVVIVVVLAIVGYFLTRRRSN